MKKLVCTWMIAILFNFGRFISAETDDHEVSQDIYDNLDLFANGLALIQRDYVDEVPPQKLIYGALKGMLGALDPHSQFLDPEAYQEIQVETEGEFGGLGVEITLQDNFLTVVSSIEGTPAFNAGILPKDRILKIDGKSTKDLTLDEAVKKLRGKPGTRVRLTILRSDKKEILDYEMERSIIKLESISDARLVEGRIGYVRVTDFQEHTAEDLERVVKELARDPLGGLILDLRHNPGGLLEAATEVANLFIKKDSLIVSTKGRKISQNMEFRAKEDERIHLPLVILVNHGSASASEIVAGAIQDLKRGVIVGERTFGKGSVQSVIPLKDGSALKLTTAKYLTPSGKSIQGKGIKPDVIVKLSADEMLELRTLWRRKKAKLKSKGRSRDRQLQTAVDLLKGKMIFQEVNLQS